MKNKCFFALDLSLTQTGITVFKVTPKGDIAPLYVGSINTKKVETRSGKLDFIATKLLELKNKYNPSEIAYEKGFSRFHASTQAIFQVSGVCLYLFHGLVQEFYAPATIKKSVGGSGKTNKEELRKVVEGLYPSVHFSNEDESDSFAVGLHHISLMEF